MLTCLEYISHLYSFSFLSHFFSPQTHVPKNNDGFFEWEPIVLF